MDTRAFARGSAALVVVSTALLVGAAATIACSDSSTETKSNDEVERDRAKNYYLDRVHVGISACINCHSGAAGPRFMATDPEASYTALEKTVGLIAAPKNSPLVNYVHKDTTVAISPEQRSLLTQWLGLEAAARGLEGAIPRPKSVTDAYKQFADCMNFDVWTYYRMGDVAFSQTDQEGPCLGCHSTGQGTAWLSAGSRETFEKMKQFPYIQKLVVGKLDGNGSFEALQPSNRLFEKANEVCPPDSTTCHPRFGLPPNIINSVRNFVDATLQNIVTGTCLSGIVVPQVDAGPKDAGDGG
jgi:hypothetical protein